MIPAVDDLILVTGGNGFIGSHVVQHFLERGNRVRVVDTLELLIGNLLDNSLCLKAVAGVHTICHFAANMGGMGIIHCDNDFRIYVQNHTMTINLLAAASAAGVKQFLYASSACVYPQSLQESTSTDVSLRESDVWTNPPPRPQGLYGLEKLSTEMLLAQHASSMTIRIARFHNVYGPGGAWNNGREKAPAALLRKGIASRMLATSPLFIEIWGDGNQRRSFLWIGDCVDAVVQLLGSSCTGPVNIGSDDAISIHRLAEIALISAGMDPTRVGFQYNSSCTKLVELDWEPRTPLDVGMRSTAEWIERQMVKHLRLRGTGTAQARTSFLTQTFAASLARTTSNDALSANATFRLRVYVAIDEDDHFLLPKNGVNEVAAILLQNGITDVSTSICSFPRGHVCSLWRHLARKAWEEECTYFVLMGDDIVLEDEAFGSVAKDQGVPFGFGCVAFTDCTFEGMPTFPIVHRVHLDIFGGIVVPDEFVNQDGDPYLFQLYRRWGCSKMIEPRISNHVGGSNNARYEKIHAADWTFRTLQDGVSIAEDWLRREGSSAEQKLTLDIVIPCYRVQLDLLRPILRLQSSPACSVSIIIIIDDPHSSSIAQLEKEYAKRPDVRIRVNAQNMGASFSRNRGLAEATAKWVLFLDDDVCVEPDLLVEAEKAAGFAAIHLSGVTWFWNIAQKISSSDLPWGVTANLIARRDLKDDVRFDLSFPKTGGGEDIDFCRKKRDASIATGNQGFFPAPNVRVTHPWWSGGKRAYRRFYMWGQGDGGLIGRYPELSYRDFPNSAELLLGSVVLFSTGIISGVAGRSWAISSLALKWAFAILCANIVHDSYRHLWRDRERTRDFETEVAGPRWLAAVVESSLLRMASEGGRVVGILKRQETYLLGKRFDCKIWNISQRVYVVCSMLPIKFAYVPPYFCTELRA
ncbi:NAD-dependent epimerase/dehydratase [Mycena galericulata]|nr:NAD-dependent epimerase/dehydratase [Mycena galericulata]